MDGTKLADIDDLPVLDRAWVEARVDRGLTQAPDTGGPNRHTAWLATINSDGSPHVTVEPGGATRWRFPATYGPFRA